MLNESFKANNCLLLDTAHESDGINVFHLRFFFFLLASETNGMFLRAAHLQRPLNNVCGVSKEREGGGEWREGERERDKEKERELHPLGLYFSL